MDEEERRRRNQEEAARNARLLARQNLPALHQAASREYTGRMFTLGPMTLVCRHCNAVYFRCERTTQGVYTKCCRNGQVLLNRPAYPEEFRQLLDADSPFYRNHHNIRHRNFFDRIRQYNSAFAFISIAVNLSLPAGRGPYCYRVQGSLRYNIANINRAQRRPAFNNLFFLEPERANEIRQELHNDQMEQQIVNRISIFLTANNPFARGYANMREVVEQTEREGRTIRDLRLVFNQARYTGGGGDHPGRYNLPAENQDVCAVFNDPDGQPPYAQSLWVYVRDDANRGRLREMNWIDPNVDPMAYPLLFPLGEPGWAPNMGRQGARGRITFTAFYSHIFQHRPGTFNQTLMAGKLTQQYMVDAYLKVEANKLSYLRENQAQLRVEAYNGLIDYLGYQDIEAVPPGQLFILPSTFIGSPRSHRQNYLDAMSIVTKYGKPDFFLTFTCNPGWTEIRENSLGLTSNYRPDLVNRVFNAKVQEFLKDIREGYILGEAIAFVYVIEFQKRGLPHMHLLLFLSNEDKIRTADDIDRYVTAELPPEYDPLHALVSEFMIHGPCNQRCLKDDGSCSKGFPKAYRNITEFAVNGFPRYRRREQEMRRQDEGERRDLSNAYVVPYNRYLLNKYKAHINIEVCSSLRSVKYLFKYLYKGNDRSCIQMTVPNVNADEREEPPNVHIHEPEAVNEPVVIEGADEAIPGERAVPENVVENNPYDEIQSFLNARYISAPESMWHLFDYKMNDKSHAVFRLPVHLQDRQPVFFEAGQEEDAVNRHRQRNTMLTAWFLLNREDPQARQYLYTEVPLHYVFEDNIRDARYIWKQRQRITKDVIGRMMTVKPNEGERFYLRIILLHVRGARSFEDLKTVEGVAYPTFREAAARLNLLADDAEYRMCLEEASRLQSPRQMRQIFAYLIAFCDLESPLELWNEFKAAMTEDFLRRLGEVILDTPIRQRAENAALRHISSILRRHGVDLVNLGFPVANADAEILPEDDVIDEDRERITAAGNQELLNAEQRRIYDAVVDCLNNDDIAERYFYVDGPGGTGKSFLFNNLIGYARGQRWHCIAMASTGIAATLLKGGQTVHSHFRLPIPVVENSVGRIAPDSETGAAIRRCKLIIWDEIAMATGHLLRAVDRTLRDLTQVHDRPFGGICLLTGGDFRQCAPIVAGGERVDVVNNTVKYSPLWEFFQIYRLRQNMRVNAEENQFKEWLVSIGQADPHVCTELPPRGSGKYQVRIPQQVLTNSIVEDIFGGEHLEHLDTEDAVIRNSVILCPKNTSVHALNAKLLEKIPGDSKLYYSADRVANVEVGPADAADLFPAEFLYSITPSGMPRHVLELKVGAIIILLRNLDAKEGLCNGTRMIVRELHNHLIVAETMDERQMRVFIPKLDLKSNDPSLPFELLRRQFPVQLAFAMSINKAQGQTFQRVGVYLHEPVFGHGQLYVALSRVRSQHNLRIQIRSIDDLILTDLREDHVTNNIVFTDILN